MTPERWHRIQTIFACVAELAPEARMTRLTADCRGEPGLRREIETLLDADDRARDGWSIERLVARAMRGLLG